MIVWCRPSHSIGGKKKRANLEEKPLPLHFKTTKNGFGDQIEWNLVVDCIGVQCQN